MLSREHSLSISRYEGCLMGCAVGDALGQPIEFLPEGSRIDKFPNADEIRSFRRLLQEKYHGVVIEMIKSPLRVFREGEYTDDTDQTLDLTDSLIERGLDPEDFAQRLIRWYDQLGPKGCGKTTREVITLLKQGKSWQEAGQTVYENGAPPANGSLMRTSPIGLYFAGNPDQVDEAAAVISKVTHPHSEAIASCQIMSQLIHMLVTGWERETAIDYVRTRYADFYQQVLDVDTTKHLGGALVTLHIALETFIKADNFKDAVIKAINRSGDTDSYGAVTGALAGTYYGVEQIPFSWRQVLNPLDAQQIAEKGRKLFWASQGN